MKNILRIVVFIIFLSFLNLEILLAQNESLELDIKNSQDKIKHETSLKVINTFIPYNDITKILNELDRRYIILPYKEFENLKKNKAAEIELENNAQKLRAPINFRFISSQINGEVEKDFIRFVADFYLESFVDEWNKAKLLSGCLALESININDSIAPIIDYWSNQYQTQKIDFQQNFNFTRQYNWYNVDFIVPFKGKGKFHIKAKFIVPIRSRDGLYTVEFNTCSVPITLLNIIAPNQNWKIEEVSFPDWNIEYIHREQNQDNFAGSKFFGWVGANSFIKISWRTKNETITSRDIQQPQSQIEPPEKKDVLQIQTQEQEQKNLEQHKEVKINITKPTPKPTPQPIIYARSENLLTISDNVVNGRIDIDLQIVRSSISSITLEIPNSVEISSIRSDKPLNFSIVEEAKTKKVFIDFLTAREEFCPLYVNYDIKLDENTTSIEIPNIYPLNVEREIGFIAVQSLVSLELVDNANYQIDLNNAAKIDPTELPESFKRKAFRPILMAYRVIKRPTNLLINFKRYKNVPLQTAVVDLMDVKTSFTTIGNAQMQVIYKVRNNNKQYISVKLATGSEIISVTRDNKPIKIVTAKEDGKIQIPLNMSKSYGVPAESEIKLLFKTTTKPLKRLGTLNFTVPLIDIPTSQFNWDIYVPNQYTALNFVGNVSPSFEEPYLLFIFKGAKLLFELVLLSIFDPVFFIFLFIIIIIFMFYFARNLLYRILKSLYITITESTFRKKIRALEITFVIAIVGILAVIAVPNFRKAREQSRDKACNSNCRVLQGAVEMYNMDNSLAMNTLDIDLLLQKGYIKDRPYCPSAGKMNTYYGFNLTSNGLVFCSIHGAPGIPNYGKTPAANVYDKTLATEIKEDKSKDFSQLPSTPVARDKSVLPVEVRFVATGMPYKLKKSIVIPTIKPDGSIEANPTVPYIKFLVIRNEILKAIFVFCFIAGYLIASNFISAVYYKSLYRFIFSVLLILIVSYFDMIDAYAGFSANAGIFLALIVGLVMQIIKSNYNENNPQNSDNPNNPLEPNKNLLYDDNSLSRKLQNPGISNTSFSIYTNLVEVLMIFFTQMRVFIINLIKIVNKNLQRSRIFFAKIVHKNSVKVHMSLNTTMKTKLKITLLTVVFILLYLILYADFYSAHAQTVKSVKQQSQIEEIKIYIPFSDIASLMRNIDDFVILPQDEYKKLLPTPKTDISEVYKLPSTYSITKAHYYAKLAEKGLRFKAYYQIVLLKDSWHKIPLLSSEVIPNEAYINDEKLPLSYFDDYNNGCYGVYLYGTGTKDISVEFFLPPLTKEEVTTKKYSLNLIPTYQTFLEVILPDNNYGLWIDPGIIVNVSSETSKITYNCVIPPTEKLLIEVSRKVNIQVPKQIVSKPEVEPKTQQSKDEKTIKATAPLEIREIPTKVNSKELTLVSFDESYIKGISVYFLNVTGIAGISSISFEIPSNYRIIKVVNNNLDDWKLEDSNKQNYKILSILFTTNIKGQSQVIIEYDIDFVHQSFETLNFDFIPIKILNVERALGSIGFSCVHTLEIQSIEKDKREDILIPIDPSEFKSEFNFANVDKLPLAYKFTKFVDTIPLLISRPKDVEQTTAVIDNVEAVTLITEEGYAITHVIYEIRNNSEQFLKLRFSNNLENTFELWSCHLNNQPVKAGYDEQNMYYNIPIVKSQVVEKVAKPFYAKVVFIQRIPKLNSSISVNIFLPSVHLDISEAKWAVYLPNGYQIINFDGNLDRMIYPANFALDYEFKSSKPVIENIGFAGFLPVEFTLPVSINDTPIRFGMQQVNSNSDLLQLKLNIVHPDKNIGRLLKWIILLFGFLAGISFMCIFTSSYKKLSFGLLLLNIIIYALLLYADIKYVSMYVHSTFSTAIFMILFYYIFKPSASACISNNEAVSPNVDKN